MPCAPVLSWPHRCTPSCAQRLAPRPGRHPCSGRRGAHHLRLCRRAQGGRGGGGQPRAGRLPPPLHGHAGPGLGVRLRGTPRELRWPMLAGWLAEQPVGPTTPLLLVSKPAFTRIRSACCRRRAPCSSTAPERRSPFPSMELPVCPPPSPAEAPASPLVSNNPCCPDPVPVPVPGQ